MYGLFLGAGFSKWAANLPLADELFDFDLSLPGPRESRKLEIVRSLKENWDEEHPSGLSEQFIQYALEVEDNNAGPLLWYIARRLTEPFIWREFHAGRLRRHALMIDESRKFGIPGVSSAGDFIQKFSGLDCAGIITTNYDMLVEYSLGSQGFNYGLQNQELRGRGPYPVSTWRNPVRLTDKIRVAKIHGSVSWDETGYYSEGRRGLTGDALIVPPTFKKMYELPLVRSAWELARDT